ncbi:MAG: hypothetical protein H7338_22785 [Candidatus Sericytochromatia bacterium]|nr:hypothetical protein [Candidatus Sericytochromatia bacterium]
MAEATQVDFFAGRRAVIATMHGKEAVIGPLLEQATGLRTFPVVGMDTDRFGTFTLEVDRRGNQLEAARAKARAALALTAADLAIASEGSFGPHPQVPWMVSGRELVVLLDPYHGVELVGQVLTTKTNCDQAVVATWAEAQAFADRVGFPSHGLVVRSGAKADSAVAAKGVADAASYEAVIRQALAQAGDGRILVETDMRAHLNPTRMAAIGEATRDLLRVMQALCPTCRRPGYVVVEIVPGLPCAWCARATRQPLSARFRCRGCGMEEVRLYPDGATKADPGRCDSCNP